MTGFSIKIENPWFLLLLIPAVIFSVIPYFRMNKRYRFTRNRISSIVLHVVIMVLAVSVLAKVTFEYDIPNGQNEVILLVDTTDSSTDAENRRNSFIQSVIMSTDEKFKLGIVTFGYDQVVASELAHPTPDTYGQYLSAPSPDTTATDIASALTFAESLLTQPEIGRIVLVSDAVETDGSVASVIKAIAAKGTKVDTVYLQANDIGNEVEIVSMTLPEEKIRVGVPFEVELTLNSSHTGLAYILPFDNDVSGSISTVLLTGGMQTIKVHCLFSFPGMHRLYFELSTENDRLSQNNTYTSHVYLDVYDKLLVIESVDGESEAFRNMLRDELQVDVINVRDPEAMPTEVNQLRNYDEVVLVNVSNADMPTGFDELLYSYVHDIGGGLFTVCGNKPDTNSSDGSWSANAYTMDDMYGTLYQQMLPVEVIEYTPPVAVIIIIDRSGSMYSPSDGTSEEESKLGFAKLGAKACLDALTERDYVGIMTLSDNYEESIEITPRPHYDRIVSAIDQIEGGGGGTIFSDAIERAGKTLAALTSVEKKHIIIVTDGQPTDHDVEKYTARLEENAKLGITTSIVGVKCDGSAKATMKNALVDYAGMTEDDFYDISNLEDLPTAMRESLNIPEIKDVNYTPFQPAVAVQNQITAGIEPTEIPELDGFYGLKIKKGATAVLMGQFTPIYAQWQFGKGTVGTFACDLNGTWSSKWIESSTGSLLINNIVTAIFPSESVRYNDLELEIEGDNYATTLSIFTEMMEGNVIEVTITSPQTGSDASVTTIHADHLNYSRIKFSVKTPGLHKITAVKKSADGTVLAENTIYKSLAYSKEYEVFHDREEAERLAASISAESGGVVIHEPWQVFENAVQKIHKTIDPKFAFLIISLVLFLLDIAVRKFKWKWPHEIIRDKRAKDEIAQRAEKGRKI